MMIWITLVAVILIGGAVWTAAIMKRSGAYGQRDGDNSGPVQHHPYALNPIIWVYVAAFVVFLGVIVVVWMSGR